MSLQRFHEAQADPHAGYGTALAEIRRGRKTSHWIWYIFPQLASLGSSHMAKRYGIRDLAEACDYLRDPLLRARYEEIATAVVDRLARGVGLETLMGSRMDALKLISSLTLFRIAGATLIAEETSSRSLRTLCDSVLNQSRAQGFLTCSKTEATITGGS